MCGGVGRPHVQDHALVPRVPSGRIVGVAGQDGCLGLTQSEHGTGVVTAQDALGFGGRADDLDVIGTVVRTRIFTPEQIAAIVAYERSL